MLSNRHALHGNCQDLFGLLAENGISQDQNTGLFKINANDRVIQMGHVGDLLVEKVTLPKHFFLVADGARLIPCPCLHQIDFVMLRFTAGGVHDEKSDRFWCIVPLDERVGEL